MDYRDLTEKDCMYQDRLIREYRQKLSGLPEGRLLASVLGTFRNARRQTVQGEDHE